MAKPTALVDRVKALGEAADLARGRASETVVDEAQRVVTQAGRRLAFSGDWTVVALAGATGSGKSSTFNAISGTALAQAGVRRPTTSKAMAAVWGTELPNDLLDWLEVPRRHLVATQSTDFANLVLLDLPDHDSTATQHRLEVDRLVLLVDMLVWVVDPQKYADAALHDRYLKPLADHAEVMLVVLNQSDRLSADELRRCLADLRKLLDSEGLGKAQLLAMSALTGAGVAAVRSAVTKAVGAKALAARRLGADVSAASNALAAELGSADPGPLAKARVQQLTRSLSEAASVGVVEEAVAKAWRHRGALATGWPALSWLGRLRADPLRRLHLDRAPRSQPEIEPARVNRTSLPVASPVQQARVDSAIRSLADDAAAGLPRGWADTVKTAARSNVKTLADRLDKAVATTDLNLSAGQGWWVAITAVQWVLIAAVVAGLGWLGLDFALLYFQWPALPKVTWWNLPAPTVLAVGGALAGVVLAGIARVGVELGAAHKAKRAGVTLRAAIAQVAKADVVDPVNAELDRYRRAAAAIARSR